MKIYNTLTRTKEEFKTIEPGKVKMYACGPTVYNYFHLGNARPFVTFDTLARYLEYSGYEVTFVQNFTDIDDKMIKRANEEGITVEQLADRFIKEYYVDADGLNIKRQSAQPRATHSMKAIIGLIKAMEEKGYTYIIEGDGVYYDVTKKADYGKLSHYNLDELAAGGGERKASYEGKRNPGDFALWKFKKEGEPFWGSPWGEGRPGWHIECSAMIKQYLGDTIDIHGGGQDLIFPHHENEIAQSEAANGCTFCNYWVHNAFVNIDGEKMSKSLGNFFTIRDIAQKYPYNVIRFFILLGHYRSPINFSDELLAAAQTSLGRISNCVRNADFVLNGGNLAGDAEADKVLAEAVQAATDCFKAHMDDDLNSADAITDIFNLVRQTNTSAQEAKVSADVLKAARDKIVELTGVLGILLDLEDEIPEEITELANKRAEAKKAKDYAEADRIRDEIQAKGYTVKDVPGGFKIEKAN
ncbi:cysteine--tRNA ligase [Butyrivibrio sp. AE2032]|uniref:cysteine--tRNA ligase n=1 Tax=Butyrivibrio sp. AE2032 TaxID=1458463 RepID=UPI00054F0A61|nr:cysteine--tRNA ligase [Butyrivibrio sp. AE2032]